ncbi:hypothetical protein J0X19_09720 [Hymenobacter sp. BT186]|uniref:Uncharacterized protein n=1 Tax=Hymenobacter telluris TaxID=2816474 RepID=A0A939EX31_9BACT|nr:hypothetical protein [Hymenobacter telluris]MBO0358220.1 hypothetical protein [Hymenobacter telluris]MBW3374246.1 hypothetical protein [Hymenobacter norwichensis]
MAKHNQVNPTGSSLSATDSLTDTAASLGNVSDDSFETTTSQPTASASTAEGSQPQDTQRKSWLNQDELLKNVNLNQLPQSVKDFGSKAVDQFNSLTTQQKVIGGALLVSGLSWLALRSKKSKASSDIYAPYNPKKNEDSKWKSSNESVYRGASAGLHNSDTTYGIENGF